MNDNDSALVVDGEFSEDRSLQTNNYLPALTVKQAIDRYNQMKQYVEGLMKDGTDYGTIPGTPKATLLKPGAEKLTTLFGFTVKFIDERTVEHWEDQAPFFFYQRKCQLYRGDFLIAEASGSANSNESRYRWRWVSEDRIPKGMEKTDLVTRGGTEGVWGFAYDKRETSGKYGKPETYWQHIDECLANGTGRTIQKPQPWKNNEPGIFVEFSNTEYRVPNEDIFSLVNTVLKMAEKRALIAAVLIGCNASEFFTQDLEDIGNIEPSKVQVKQPEPKLEYTSEQIAVVLKYAPKDTKLDAAVKFLTTAKIPTATTPEKVDAFCVKYNALLADGLDKKGAAEDARKVLAT